MNPVFAQIIKRFQEKQIPLQAYTSYLDLCFRFPYESLSARLKKQGIVLEHYLDYLENSEKKRQIPSPFLVQAQASSKKYGPYLVLEELGRGGMGAVYKAYHPELQRIVALKVLLAGSQASEQAQKRFLREIEVMAKLQHEGIVQIYDSGETQGEFYLTMEYIEGTSLLKKLEEFTVREKIESIHQVLEALDYAHQQGIIHRDLKLENILVTAENKTKIADFGLAKWSEESIERQEKLTHRGILLGTALYMAPEQARGATEEIDAQSDLYAIGVCLYYLMTQKYPFTASTLNQLLAHILQKEVLPPSQIVSKVHPDLEAIILKALEKEKSQRYQNATLFAKDLRSFLEGTPVEAQNLKTKTRLQKWAKRHHQKLKKFTLFSLMFFFFVITFFLLNYGEQQKQFQTQYQKILQGLEKNISNVHFNSITHSLRSWNDFNQLLLLFPQNKQAEHKKWELGEHLLTQILQQKEYKLGDYLIQEMQLLTSIPQQIRESRLQLWKSQKNEQGTQEEKQFKTWIFRWQEKPLEKNRAEEAFYEIAQMKSSAMDLLLMQYFQEGNRFFLQGQVKQEPQKTAYYLWILKLVTKRKLKNATSSISETLQALIEKQIYFPEGEQDLHVLSYLIELSKSLSFLAPSLETMQLLHQLRWKMKPKTLYWNRTEKLYQKMSLLHSQQTHSSLKNAEEYAKRGLELLDTEQIDQAISDFTEAIRLAPRFAELYHNRGYAKQRKHDVEGAILDFNEAIRLNPNFAESYNARGNAKQKKGDFEGAIEDYNKSILIAPHFLLSYVNRGSVKQKTGNLAGALADFTEAIHLNPQYAEAYSHRAQLKEDQKDLQGALEDYNQALRFYPENFSLFINRGRVKQELQDFDGAIQDYNEAIRLNPKDDFAYNNRGVAKHFKRDFDGAISDYTETLRLNPQFTEAYYNRGSSYQLKKQYSEAMRDYNQAISQNPEYALAYNNRAFIKKQQKDLQSALADYAKTIQLRPDIATAHLNRGYIYFDLQQPENALKDFHQFLTLIREYQQETHYKKTIEWIFDQFPELKPQ